MTGHFGIHKHTCPANDVESPLIYWIVGMHFFDYEPPDPYPDNIYGLRGRQRFHTIGFQGLPVPDWLLRELPLAVRARRGMYRVYSKAGLIAHCAATPGIGVRRAPQSGRHGVDSRCLNSLCRWSFGGRSCEWRLPLLLVLLYWVEWGEYCDVPTENIVVLSMISRALVFWDKIPLQICLWYRKLLIFLHLCTTSETLEGDINEFSLKLFRWMRPAPS